MMTLVLVRGLPGSGKSTLASSMTGFIHYEADQFFLVNGVYVYDHSKIKEAHKACQELTLSALRPGESVVVSNTFRQLWELEIYLKMRFKTTIVEASGDYLNLHNVSAESIQFMKDTWEVLTAEFKEKYRL